MKKAISILMCILLACALLAGCTPRIPSGSTPRPVITRMPTPEPGPFEVYKEYEGEKWFNMSMHYSYIQICPDDFGPRNYDAMDAAARIIKDLGFGTYTFRLIEESKPGDPLAGKENKKYSVIWHYDGDKLLIDISYIGGREK